MAVESQGIGVLAAESRELEVWKPVRKLEVWEPEAGELQVWESEFRELEVWQPEVFSTPTTGSGGTWKPLKPGPWRHLKAPKDT